MIADTVPGFSFYRLSFHCTACGDDWIESRTVVDTANCDCGALDIEPVDVVEIIAGQTQPAT